MASRYIRAPHPKTEIRPTAEAIQKILKAGWVGQLKIHGHRVQLHIPADADETVLTYNRQGNLHKKLLTAPMLRELRRLLAPKQDYTVIDAEWIKPDDKIYLFDTLKKDGELLSRLSFADRWKKLPRAYLSPHFETLPLLTTLNACMDALEQARASGDEDIEGLVFKSPSPGFADTSIIRCRLKPDSKG